MQWKCAHCGAENGPEAVYCPTCGEAGEEDEEKPALEGARRGDGSESRSTLVGTSTGVAPSLLDRPSDPGLAQPLPRRVRVAMSGWGALIGGWSELSLCLVVVPLVAGGTFYFLLPILGFGGAAAAVSGIILFLLIALLYGAGETTRAIKGLRLVRSGWAAGGEIRHKLKKSSRLGTTFLVEYSFVDAGGVHHRNRQEVTPEQWQEAQPRNPVTVLYDPARPEESLIYEYSGVAAVLPVGAPSRREALPAPESEGGC